MKVLGFSLWKWQFLRLGNRIANSGSSISYVGDSKTPPLSCSSSLRHLILKLKYQWKHNLRLQKRTVQYSYDLQSYSLNFDDGLLH
ncbi:hypothetical protein SDJN03_03672, partial [Cucurbita argyrosperma subsp. sororia]